jgi:long-chain acyl-CoA synthetase
LLRKWADEYKLHYGTPLDLVANEKVIQFMQKEIDQCNSHLGKSEQIKKFALLTDAWTIENGELTPTLKLKRKIILARYAGMKESLYANQTSDNQD